MTVIHRDLMVFNPDKCEHILITSKRKVIQTSYNIHGHTLNKTFKAKYLGVTIDNTLSWNSHVDTVTKKANRTTAFLRRNLSSCPKDVKAKCYKSIVRPQLEYASPTVWDPITKSNIVKVESVQRRVARFWYHKLRKTFSKFYRRHYELVSKFNVGLKTLLHQGLSEPEFYGDLVYKFKKIVGRVDFSDQFRKIIVRYKRIGYNINIMRQSACLEFNPITVNNFASLFNCTPVGRASLNDGPDIKLFILVGLGRSFFVCCLAHRGSAVGFLLLQCSSGVVRHPRDLQVSSPHLCFIILFICDLFVSRDDPLMS